MQSGLLAPSLKSSVRSSNVPRLREPAAAAATSMRRSEHEGRGDSNRDEIRRQEELSRIDTDIGRALNRKIILESTAVMESIAEKVEIRIRKRLEELEAEVKMMKTKMRHISEQKNEMEQQLNILKRKRVSEPDEEGMESPQIEVYSNEAPGH